MKEYSTNERDGGVRRVMRGRDGVRRNEQESKLRGQRVGKKRLRKKESVEQPNQRLAKCIGDLVSLPFPGFLSLINV